MRDDHTLLVSFAAPISVFPLTHDKLPYDPARDFVPISSITIAFSAIAAPVSLKVGSLADLVALARSQPGKINYAPGAGAMSILFAGFVKAAGVDMTSVGYRDFNLAVQDLAEGRIQATLSSFPIVLPQVHAGKVRFLTVTNKERAPLVPEVPTAAEAGYPALTYDGITGFFGPCDMSPELRDRISGGSRQHKHSGGR